MLIGIMGKMGSGKTLSMVVLASFMRRISGAPLYSNMASFKESQLLERSTSLWDLDSGIVCLDELWLTMDARLWKDNVFLTRWINQTRKKKLIVFYTTQHIRQVELRVRTGTDFLVFTEKKSQGIWLSFIDWQYRTLGRRFLITNPRPFYGLYDTYETLRPLT